MRRRALFLWLFLATAAPGAELVPVGGLVPDPVARLYRISRPGDETRAAYLGERLVAYFGACRESLGELPDLETDRELTFPLDVFLGGRKVERVGYRLQYADDPREPVPARFLEGGKLAFCDNPSLAGTGSPCDRFGSELFRLRARRESVHWVAISRPGFPLGVIGWNRRTGASCLFSVSPGGRRAFASYGKAPGDAALARLVWGTPDGPDNCLKCHTNPDPFVVTKHLVHLWPRLGIRRKSRFEDGEYRFHVPGRQFSDLVPRSHTLEVRGPDGKENQSCRGCHELTASGDERRLVLLDALGDSILRAGGRAEPAGFHAAAWMPPEPATEGPDTQAAQALRRYLAGDEYEPAVVARPVGEACERRTAPKAPTSLRVTVARDVVTLRWSLDVRGEEADEIRFAVAARATVPRGPAILFRAPDLVGVEPENEAFPRREWVFHHALPRVPSASRLAYDVHAVRVSRRGPICAEAETGPVASISLPLSPRRKP